jgi:binding-protein-dependent transport system inner membrane component/NMT1/THI5 like protein
MAYISRRSALTIIAGGSATLAGGAARAMDTNGRVIYPVAVPIYQTQFVADRIGYFREAGLDCKLIQGGSGVKTREIIASSQGDIGIGDITHPMQLSNHGRAGRVLMPVDTRSSAVMFIIRKVFASLTPAISFALIGVIVGEFIGAERGIGRLIIESEARGEASGMMVAVIILMLVGVILSTLIWQLQAYLLRWQRHNMAE